MTYRIFLSAVMFLAIAAMVVDQVRLKNMRAWKWPVAAVLLTVLEVTVWMN